MKEITQKQIFDVIVKNTAISAHYIAQELHCDYYDVYPILSTQMHDICMRNPNGDYAQWIVRPYFTTKGSSFCVCPKCHSIMKKKIAKSGVYDGDEFWGCSKYPECDCLVTIVQRSRLKEFGLEDKIIDK